MSLKSSSDDVTWVGVGWGWVSKFENKKNKKSEGVDLERVSSHASVRSKHHHQAKFLTSQTGNLVQNMKVSQYKKMTYSCSQKINHLDFLHSMSFVFTLHSSFTELLFFFSFLYELILPESPDRTCPFKNNSSFADFICYTVTTRFWLLLLLI